MLNDHAIGVLPTHDRSGAGRALQERAEAWLRGQGVRFLQVKTISESSKDPNDSVTRRFYASMGFEALEEMPKL